MDTFTWTSSQEHVDWFALQELYRIAPLEHKPADALQVVFTNSRFKCFVYEGTVLIGVGRALADGVDCSYICDVAIHPDYQGIGLGKRIIDELKRLSQGHKKIILYANVGKEGFYQKMGFKKMNTAMAIFSNETQALESGLLSAIDI